MAGQSVETQIIKALEKFDNNTVGAPFRALPRKLQLNCNWKQFTDALASLVADKRVERRDSEGKRVELVLCD